MTGSPRRRSLSNGLSVVALERRRLPLVGIHLALPAGGAFDPPRLPGLAGLVGEGLARGTRRRAADRFHALLEAMGGKLSVQVGWDRTVVETEVPVDRAEGAARLLAEAVAEPRFSPGEIARTRRLRIAGIESDLDDPSLLADRLARQSLFEGHPYGHPPDGTRAALARATRSEVTAFHRRRFVPRGGVLVVAGDLPAERALDLAEGVFGRWRGAPPEPPALPEPRPPRGVRIRVVDKPGATQVQVRIASRGIPFRSPLQAAARVAVSAFGGGFTARLMQALRVEEGLTYGAGASLRMHAAGGGIVLRSSTRTESLRRLVERALAASARVREEGFSEDEIEWARRRLTTAHAFAQETHLGTADLLTEAALLAGEWGFVEAFPARVRAVAPSEVADFARAYLPERDYVLVAVGEAPRLVEALRPLAPVEVVALRAVS